MATVSVVLSKPDTGAPLLKQGFRLFFLGTCVWAIVCMLAWMSLYIGPFEPSFGLPMLAWHQHELLFGYTGAAVAGFLLTASANWASRPPLSGLGLLALFSLWLVARLALLLPDGVVPPLLLLIVLLAFPVALIVFVAHELIRGGATRNLLVLAIVAVHAVAGGVFLYEIWLGVDPRLGIRLGLGALLVLLMLIGGRVVPAFTRNWLARTAPASLPAAFSRFDGFTLAFSLASLLAWSVLPDSTALALALLISGVLNTLRLVRWQGHRTVGEPLVLILHVAYAFIPLGFAMTGLAMLHPVLAPGSAATHVWTTGAISLMCLAVMTRASLGHMGQPLKTDRLILSIYGVLLLCIGTRLVASYGLAYREMLALSAASWCVAHALFIVRYAPGFLTQR